MGKNSAQLVQCTDRRQGVNAVQKFPIYLTLVSARIGRKDMLCTCDQERDHRSCVTKNISIIGIGKRVIPKVLEYPTNILLQRIVAPAWSLMSYPICMILDSSERMDQRGRLSIYEGDEKTAVLILRIFCTRAYCSRELPQPNINCADCSEDGRRRLPVDGTAGKRAVLHSSRKIHRATVGGIRHTRKDGDENRERSVITKGFSFECGGEYGGHASTNSQGKAPYENVWGSLRDDWLMNKRDEAVIAFQGQIGTL
ncbi:hypothetical protein B0H14DRAFT_2561682 [Mycena olivaceomarginata]|nr:hypothetical protein B0H14DRAFT_2561682 [Mycena olivaceomarginata]